MKKLLAVLLIVVGIIFLLGCTSQQAPPSAGLGNSTISAPPAGAGTVPPGPPSGTGNGNGQQTGTQSTINNTNNSLADNKTGYEKNQTIISLLIADGTYTNDVQYQNPRGMNDVIMSVTVKNDTITTASVTDGSGGMMDMMTARYVSNFNAALPGLVVGKKINELSIPRNVAGSSLTTAAFAQYVDWLVKNPPAQG